MERSPQRVPTDLAERIPLGICTFAADDKLLFANAHARRLLDAPLPRSELRRDLIARLGEGCAGLATLAVGQRLVVPVAGRLLEVDARRPTTAACCGW